MNDMIARFFGGSKSSKRNAVTGHARHQKKSVKVWDIHFDLTLRMKYRDRTIIGNITRNVVVEMPTM